DFAHSYNGIAAYYGDPENMTLSDRGMPEILHGARVSSNFLNVLGVAPLLGRSFLPPEDDPGAPNVAMISAQLWQRRFHDDPGIAGRTVDLEGSPHTIVGVLPAGFQFPFSGVDAWVTKPSESSRITGASRITSPVLHVFGRLRPNVSLQQAD